MTTIGRDESADLVINNPAISRVHAKVAHNGQHFVIADFSRNGMTINGRRVKKAVLREGDVIGLGKFLIWFSLSGGVPPASLQKPRAGRTPRDLEPTLVVDAITSSNFREQAVKEIREHRAEQERIHRAVKLGLTVPDDSLQPPGHAEPTSRVRRWLSAVWP